MELDPLNRQFPVAQTHDLVALALGGAGPGCDLQARGQAGLLHHQGMVAGGLEGRSRPEKTPVSA